MEIFNFIISVLAYVVSNLITLSIFINIINELNDKNNEKIK